MTQLKTPYLSILNYECDKEIVHLIPEEFARAFQVIALEKQDNILILGMVNPLNCGIIKRLEDKLNVIIQVIRVDFNSLIIKINNSY